MNIKAYLIVVLVAVASLLGCEGAVFVETEPPPLRVEVRSEPPSREAVWIDGNWSWRGHQYVWIAGHWENHRHGNWVPGYWNKRDRGYYWVKGHWDRERRDRDDRRGADEDRR